MVLTLKRELSCFFLSFLGVFCVCIYCVCAPIVLYTPTTHHHLHSPLSSVTVKYKCSMYVCVKTRQWKILIAIFLRSEYFTDKKYWWWYFNSKISLLFCFWTWCLLVCCLLYICVYVYRLELVSVCFACIVATKLTVTVPVRAGEYNVRTTPKKEKNIEK